MTEEAKKTEGSGFGEDSVFTDAAGAAQAMRVLRTARDRILAELETLTEGSEAWHGQVDWLVAIEQVLAMRELGSAVVLGGGMGLVGGLLGSSRPRTFAERLADLLSDVGPIAKAKPE